LLIGGHYLIGNCFALVIACYLPQLFYLSIGWDQAMQAMGLQPQEKVQYGSALQRSGQLDERFARRAEALARCVYSWVQPLHKRRSHVVRALIRMLFAFPSL
jgi:hypothetical protein